MAIARIRTRVVWTFGVTIETLVPTNMLSRVDLPALGAPSSATKPQRVAGAPPVTTVAARAWPGSWLAALDQGQQAFRGHLLGKPLGAALALHRRVTLDGDLVREERLVRRALAANFPIGR